MLSDKIDWFNVLACLQHNGVNNSELCRRTGISQDKVTRIKQGSEPRYVDGALILRQHSQFCVCDHFVRFRENAEHLAMTRG